MKTFLVPLVVALAFPLAASAQEQGGWETAELRPTIPPPVERVEADRAMELTYQRYPLLFSQVPASSPLIKPIDLQTVSEPEPVIVPTELPMLAAAGAKPTINKPPAMEGVPFTMTRPTLYKREEPAAEQYPQATSPSPAPVLQTVVVEQVQSGAPTWKGKIEVWKKNVVVAVQHCDLRKAQNWNDNVDWMKLKIKQSVPYLNAAFSGTGIYSNIQNWK